MSHVSSGSAPWILEVLGDRLGPAALLDSLPVGVCCVDGKGRIAFYNRRAAELWGASPAVDDADARLRLLNTTFRASDGRPLELDDSPATRVLKTGAPVRDERFVIERPDGSRATILVNADPLTAEDGARIGAVSCFQDVTAFEHGDWARQGERQLRAVLEALPAAIYTTDAEGKITFFNEAAVQLAGRTPRLDEESWCVSWRLYTLEGEPLPHDQCPTAASLRERRPVRGEEAILERPDGSRVRFQPFPTPLFDEAGQLTGAVNMLVDVTERRNADIEHAHLAAIVSSSDDAIVSKGLDGRIRSWNAGAERIFGYSAAEMVGEPIVKIIPPELRAEETEIIARLRRGERIDHFETARIAKDGRRIEVSLTVSPIRDRKGVIVGASKVARDITDRKRAEELQQLLMGELNHRVKNTLATVQSIANQTVRAAHSPSDFATTFNDRVRALARAHDVLTRSAWRGADLLALAHEQLLAGGVADERITLVGPSVLLEPQPALHLGMILHELGTNARKHGSLSAPGGRLDLSWTLEVDARRRLKLHWRESGGPPVVAPVMRGFGATLVERSLAAHEGSACIHYSAEGVSCDIELPLPERPLSEESGFAVASAPARTAGPLAPSADFAGKRVLVVEDEPVVAMDLAGMLTERGFTVIGPASTLDEALKLVDSNLDAALIGASLAGRTVEDLAAALQARQAPFAFLSGCDRDGLPEGFRHVAMVNKPFSRDEVLRTLRQLVGGGETVVRLRPKSSDNGS